ncbi:ribosome small subunit-dependent GTPase A [Halodesulfovibrio aestuarii]|uniref:Small ribosomal subunit biogenesis GTPase RsgA n=1 Tax=Halodesulfovibrio aestuarii TaxID=126333 RepID=A0A8G2FAT2_9BACT|nr:ribosome small subunit-dependent GTPase A [Halodesulfovibrio aestuarii]SHI98318.1 ribosome biogenesis GTPase [Halodesulfovibrio aestuarii]
MNKQRSSESNIDCSTSSLVLLGWNSFFQASFDGMDNPSGSPVRVSGVRRHSFLVTNGQREWLTTISGRLLHQKQEVFPAVGDWVLVKDSVITTVLPREKTLSRGASGGRGKHEDAARQQQVIAANVDIVIIVCGLDRDFNLRRIERYITLVYNCGLTPVVVLTKADTQVVPETFVCEVEAIAFGVSVHLLGFQDDTGLMKLKAHLDGSTKTAAMIGSSGAGKSTLLNRLVGKDIQRTGAVSSAVVKGKHTTTERDLIMLPDGGMIVDNPGIREIAFWDAGDGVSMSFGDIEELAAGCRFHDCSHTSEPGCRVLEAVATGTVSEERLVSYHKMKRELSYAAERQHKSAERLEKERWKDIAQIVKAIKKRR